MTKTHTSIFDLDPNMAALMSPVIVECDDKQELEDHNLVRETIAPHDRPRLGRHQAMLLLDLIRHIAYDHYCYCFGEGLICDDLEQASTCGMEYLDSSPPSSGTLIRFQRWCDIHRDQLWHLDQMLPGYEHTDGFWWAIYKGSTTCREAAMCGRRCLIKD